MTEPLVSILCTVYNKEPWLAQTIDSFLAQERDFPLEILLIDDASTDGSKAIVTATKTSIPDLIRAFYNSENQGHCQNLGGHLPRERVASISLAVTGMTFGWTSKNYKSNWPF